MTERLNADPRRDASASIRGYVYQAYQSIWAWMHLDRSDQLYLEAAEDFDIVRSGETTATQVKDRSEARVTLRNADVTDAINNYWEHVNRNKDRPIRLRFLTTAERGVEAGCPLGRAGLDYWDAAAAGRAPVAPLRALLLKLPLTEALRSYVETATDEELRLEVLSRIEWDTGTRSLDGIKSAIEDELVALGMPLGIPPKESERALDSLIAEVAALLAAKGERRLTYADFCRSFQNATMAVVPRGQAEAVRGAISTPAYPFPMAAVLGEPLPLVRGAAPRSALVDELAAELRAHGALLLWGSTGLGKTSVASLVADRISGEFVWGGFRNQDPALVAQRLAAAASEISGRGGTPRVALDDLDLESAPRFERELVRLFFQVRRMGGLVITTGYAPCPEELLEKLWLPREADRQIPYFDEADVRELLRNHGAASDEYVSAVSKLIAVSTRGHPQFVHARVRKLASQGWPKPSAEDLFGDGGVASVRTQARRRLIEELPSEPTRLLAHRLTLALGSFTRGHAFAAAGVAPPIAMPGESFEMLLGPWVERVGTDAYRVSPLLDGAGKETLPSSEVAAVNEALALYPFTKERVTAVEVGTAFLHGLLAQSKKALAQHAEFLLAKRFESVPGVAEALFVLPAMALGPGQRLFRGDPALEAMLRVIQFKTASATKRHDLVGAVIDRALDAISHVKKPMRPHIAALAYGTFLSDVTVPIPPERSIAMLTAFMRIPGEDRRIAKAIGSFESKGTAIPGALSGFSPFQTLFYFEAARMDGIDALDSLLTQLAKLSSPDRAHLLRVFDDDTFSSLIVNNAWHADAQKKRLDADRAVAVCERARAQAGEWGARALARAASVAVAVVHDEYRKDAPSALLVLDRASAVFGAQDGRVLLSRAKVLYGQKEWPAAITAFEYGLRDQTIDPVDRIFGLRLLGVSAANAGDWSKAASAFRDGAVVALAHSKLLGRMGTGLKADAAFALWKRREVADALRLYAEVLRELELIPVDRDLRSRHLHATVRHAIAWVWGCECDKRRTPSMAEPIPGMCSNQDPSEGIADFEIRDLDAIWPLLVATDEYVGAGLRLAAIARGRRGAGPAPVIVQALERGTALDALRHGKGLAEAPRSYIRFTESVVAEEKGEKAAWARTEIGALPQGYWEDAARQSSLMRFLLAAGTIATAEGMAIPVEPWREQLREVGAATTLVDRVLALLGDADESSDGTLLQEAASSLTRIRKGSLSPKALFECHFRLTNAIEGGDPEYLAGSALEKLALAWRDVAQNQRVALVAPSEHCPRIEERCTSERSGLAKMAGILDAAAPAAGVRLGPEARGFLKRLMEQTDPRMPPGPRDPPARPDRP